MAREKLPSYPEGRYRAPGPSPQRKETPDPFLAVRKEIGEMKRLLVASPAEMLLLEAMDVVSKQTEALRDENRDLRLRLSAAEERADAALEWTEREEKRQEKWGGRAWMMFSALFVLLIGGVLLAATTKLSCTPPTQTPPQVERKTSP